MSTVVPKAASAKERGNSKNKDGGMPELLLNWKNHYHSWKKFDQVPRIFIKYEDLSDQTYTVFRDLIFFINKITKNHNNFDKKKALNALSSTNFKKLKKIISSKKEQLNVTHSKYEAFINRFS